MDFIVKKREPPSYFGGSAANRSNEIRYSIASISASCKHKKNHFITEVVFDEEELDGFGETDAGIDEN